VSPFAKRADSLNSPQPKTAAEPARPAKLFVCPPKPEPVPAPEPTFNPASKKWVDWYAGQIDDPIRRLRFLKKTAPRVRLEVFWRRWHRVGLISLAALAGVAAAVYWIRPTLSWRTAVVQPAVVVVRTAEPVTGDVAPTQPAQVWQVEKTANSETYSNGLRIDDRMVVSNHPRSYLAYSLANPEGAAVRRTEPAGIVFHTTESRLAPFEPDQNGVLKKLGESLLEYVKRKRAYHFLIDRFGRVYRVVAESDSANHAGNSVWADSDWLYVNLNQSFIGVSVETRTQPGQVVAEMSPAQLRSAAMLTEMLRNKYHFTAENCVTHAQVSVNPSNRQVGYHADWASSFPFAQLGLPDNYSRPLPALWAFGFEYNPEFLHWAGNRIGAGVQLGDERLHQAASAAGQSTASYRRALQKRYRRQLEEVRAANAAADEESE